MAEVDDGLAQSWPVCQGGMLVFVLGGSGKATGWKTAGDVVVTRLRQLLERATAARDDCFLPFETNK